MSFPQNLAQKQVFRFRSFRLPNLILQAKSVSKAALELSQFGITQFHLAAKSISSASIGLDNKGEFNLAAKSISKGSLGLRVIRQENQKLVVTFRVAPRTRAAGRHKDLHQFLVNGVEIPITDYTADFPEDASGCAVQMTLAKYADRSLITPDANYTFRLGKRIAGVWQWRTIIDTGELQSSSLLIGFADKKKTDSFSLSTFEPFANSLGRSPLRDLIIYDPFRVAGNELSTPIRRDTEGRTYQAEKLAIPNLTLYKLFKEIFKVRLGFANLKTNIPDSPIKQATFSTAGSYRDGIAPHCGNFEPDFTVSGDTLWIRDTTNLLSEGFPAPAALTIDEYAEVEVSRSINRLDAYNLVFNEDKEDWDFFETVVETFPLSVTGSVFDENYSKTDLERTTRKYYRNSTPDFPVKEDVIKEVRTTRGTFNVKGKVTEEFKYDAFGRQIESNKKTETQVPEEGGESNFLELAEEEKTTITYGPHPFEPSKQVQLLVASEKKGVISVDSENPYRGKDFKQPIVVADKSGNVRESSTTEYGPTEKTTKTLQILSSKEVRVNIVHEDLINERLDFDFSEVVYGEIGARTNGRTREVLVFETPDAVFTGHGEENLPVGELPLNVAIPLARRKLKKRRLGNDVLNLSFNGLELFMDRGVSYTVFDREEGMLGVFPVKGFRFTGSNLGTRAANHKTIFRGVKV